MIRLRKDWRKIHLTWSTRLLFIAVLLESVQIGVQWLADTDKLPFTPLAGLLVLAGLNIAAFIARFCSQSKLGS